MRRIGVEERRARLGRRHVLSELAVTVEQAADDVVVLHATDPATVYLSVAARMPAATVDDVDAALFERRTMLRTLAMRRTLFVATVDALSTVERSSSIDVAANQRKQLLQFLTDSDIAHPERWLAGVSRRVLAALDDGGLSARALTAAVPELGTRIILGAGTRYAQEAGATSRVLGLMAVEGLLVRGRPAGNWTGRQYEWHRRDRWLAEAGVAVRDSELDPEAAATELVRRWLDRFGPGTLTDISWWTGWTKTKARKALVAVGAVEVELDGGPGYVLPGDERAEAADPWVALLPALDPTPMGWKERAWYLGDGQSELFDRNGNIGPTVWVDGRIVGGWSQRPDGEIVIGLLEDVGADHRAQLDAESERLAAFVGDVVVKPSFPTPLQRRLSAGD